MAMDIDVSIELPATPDEVWHLVRDIASHTDWMVDAARITFVSDQTEGVGTAFECLTRIGPLRTNDEMEVTSWVECREIGVRHRGLVTGEGRFTLEPAGFPEGTETRFAWSEQLALPWYFGGRLGEVFARPLLAMVWRRNLRKLRSIVLESQRGDLGQLIGTGRTSEVRTHGDEAVIRIGDSGEDQTHEADAMELVRAAGFPAPRVLERPRADAIVMERLEGPTMLDDLTARPWRLLGHAKTLARLHHELGSIEAPADWTQVSAGTSVVHLDLQPDNVKLTPHGPVVIDWSKAARGTASFDAAYTYVILRTAAAKSGPAANAMIAGLRRRFAKAFISAFGVDAIKPFIRPAAELRMLDDSLTAVELEQAFALARGELD